jgi:hypothetical protein
MVQLQEMVHVVTGLYDDMDDFALDLQFAHDQE